MRQLSPVDVIRVWELGQGRNNLGRGLALLASGLPGYSREDLLSLSVGQQDFCLLTLREMCLGPALHSVEICPNCQDEVGFDVNVGDIRIPRFQETESNGHEIEVDGFWVWFRLPIVQDLEYVAAASGVEDARKGLVERCVLEARHNGGQVPASSLPAHVVAALSDRMGELDPQADIEFNLICPTCGALWTTIFDVAVFFWREVVAIAQRLLYDVHALAHKYGWRESDILDMSAARRKFYLDLAA